MFGFQETREKKLCVASAREIQIIREEDRTIDDKMRSNPSRKNMDPEHATMADTYATVYRATRPQELAHVAVCDESEFR